MCEKNMSDREVRRMEEEEQKQGLLISLRRLKNEIRDFEKKKASPCWA